MDMNDDDTILRWKHKIPAEEGRKIKIDQLRAAGGKIPDDYQLSLEEKDDADRLGEEWKKKALEEYRREIPLDFKFEGRVAASAATVYDGLMDEANQEKRIIRDVDTYESGLVKTMDCAFATGDRSMHVQKELDKGGMAKSDDPKERFLVRLYNSTRLAESVAQETTSVKSAGS